MKMGSIELENGNRIVIEFFEREAPGTVANFEKLANSGFYDGLAFQRVVKGFVAQGGCPDGTGRGGTDKIPCETEGNPHKHVRGAVSMAHFGPGRAVASFLSATANSIISTVGIPFSDASRREWNTRIL